MDPTQLAGKVTAPAADTQAVEAFNARVLARDSLLLAASEVNKSLSVFSVWLAAGVGATFSLLLTNLDTVSKFVTVSYVRVALLLLVISLGFSVIAKLLSAVIASALGGHEASSAYINKSQESGAKYALNVFMFEYERSMFFYQRWIVRRSMDKAKAGDLVASARLISRLSQIYALIVIIGEASLAIVAAGILVAGLNSQ